MQICSVHKMLSPHWGGGGEFKISLICQLLGLPGRSCCIVSLTSSLVVKMLIVLISTIQNVSNSVIFAEKMWVDAKATHIFFQQKY